MAITKTEKYLSIVLMDSQGYEQNLKLENPRDDVTRQNIENALSGAIAANAEADVWVSARGYTITGIKSARLLTVTTSTTDLN